MKEIKLCKYLIHGRNCKQTVRLDGYCLRHYHIVNTGNIARSEQKQKNEIITHWRDINVHHN
jgi:hypothetical protein